MHKGLSIGRTGELQAVVSAEHTIHLGASKPVVGPVVLSTPAMIHLMERAAREAIAPYLEDDEESVGVQLQVEHLAATPVSAAVRMAAEVTGISGRLIDFRISAHDGADQIGRGTHRRAVVRLDRFRQRLAEKAQRLTEGELLPMTIAADRGPLPALQHLLVEVDGQVATVTLHRPEVNNAVNEPLTCDFERFLAWLAGHPEEVRVVIVTGSGNAFSAGNDVKEMGTLSLPAARQLIHRQAQMFLALEQLPQPVIAAVNGYALGGGCICAYSCDFRLAVPAAKFGMPGILLGWPPGYGIAQLTALVGKARTLDLCLTGKQITARQAFEIGLVHEVVPPMQLMSAARELADRLVEMPAAALRETKRLIHADEGTQPKIAHRVDTEAYLRCLATDDAREGIAAFTEKRPPRFRGK